MRFTQQVYELCSQSSDLNLGGICLMSYFIPPGKSNIIFLSWNFTGYINHIPWQALKELDVRLLAITDYEKKKNTL